jgi:hypothetical protein
MLDAPCGAMVWIPILLRRLSVETNRTFRYHGVDIVESVVNASIQKFQNYSDEWQFSTLDFTQQELPDDYELIFSRDALQHLSYDKIVGALRGFSKVKGAQHLLVGSYMVEKNRNIRVGDCFYINLMKPPFSLTQYIEIISENVKDETVKHLILYDIPNYLSKVNFDLMLNDTLKFMRK